MINSQTNLFFNQSDVEHIFAQGFVDDESRENVKKIEEVAASFPRKSNGEIGAEGVMRLLAQKGSQNSASAPVQQVAPANAYGEVELPSIDITVAVFDIYNVGSDPNVVFIGFVRSGE